VKAAAARSTEGATLDAVRQVARDVRGALGKVPPDLAFFFLSSHHAPEMEEAVALLAKELKARHLIGCSGEAIIGGAEEMELVPAMSLWAASLPGAEIRTGHITLEQTPEGFAFPGLPEIPEEPASLILLGEPHSFPVDDFIARLGEDCPRLQVLGGMASGARSPGENRLFLGPEVITDGAVAAAIWGRVRVRPLVSQGCRPFGKRLVVTKADQNLILELGGKPAFEKLREQLEAMKPSERALLDRGLHLGIAVDAKKEHHDRGDFLVRGVMGISRENGALVVTDHVKPGTTVQFHLRDADTASEDLQALLEEAKRSSLHPLGALLFSCNGRGRRMFETPSHDAGSVARSLGALPLAGFFAAGEIGPIGGRNFLHGFTASLALFEELETE
jgi:small ligand-binding sensory domain FIST